MNFLLVIISLLVMINQVSFANDVDGHWYRSGANNESTKFSTDNQINVKNIKNLELEWVYKSSEKILPGVEQTNPIFVEGLLITSVKPNFLVGVNPENGNEVWRLSLPVPVAKRGLTYSGKNIFVPTGEGVYVINAKTGKINQKIGNKGVLGSEYSVLPPIVINNLLIVANFFSSIEAIKLDTGERLWKTSIVKNNINPRIWSGFSYDVESNLIFIVTSDKNRFSLTMGEYKRIKKISDELDYSCSLIALDALTGKIVWSIQETPNDFWDLDLVGPPIVTKIYRGNNPLKVVVALSKTGNALVVDLQTGKLISKAVDKKASASDLTYSFGSDYFDPAIGFLGIEKSKKEYLAYKTRNVNFEKNAYPSLDYDIVTYGPHGGAHSTGGALDDKNNTLIVPSNSYPLILRAKLYDKNPSITERISKKNITYSNKCSVCHQSNLSGVRLDEGHGDLYFPPLTGITRIKRKDQLLSLSNFKNDHKFIFASIKDDIDLKRLNESLDFGKASLVSRLLKKAGIASPFQHRVDLEKIRGNLDKVSVDDLTELYIFFGEVDRNIESRDDFEVRIFWQLLLSNDGLPGSSPPWGYLTAIDLDNGAVKWKVPFGFVKNNRGDKLYGDMNYGGLIVTAGGIVFANGTRDNMVRAFDVNNGKELWTYQSPAAGSAPPISFMYKGCQHVVFTASGGSIYGYKGVSNELLAFKLKECKLN